MLDTKWLDTHRWMIRASNAGVSYGGFRWSDRGRWTECPDWDETPECGGGLHGETPEHNGFIPTGPRLELCEIGGPVVPLDDKIKTSRARIVATGPSVPDEAMRRCGYIAMWDGDYLPSEQTEIFTFRAASHPNSDRPQ